MISPLKFGAAISTSSHLKDSVHRWTCPPGNWSPCALKLEHIAMTSERNSLLQEEHDSHSTCRDAIVGWRPRPGSGRAKRRVACSRIFACGQSGKPDHRGVQD